jgi:outer membrane protein OmpA-like peptidoglycan-associated protein
MASRFGRDFSSVRLHTDAASSRSATDIGARAYTAGSHIVFRVGEYQPSTPAGRHLLVHELTHVLQQGQSSAAGPLVLGDPHSPAESEAERVAAGTDSAAIGPADRRAIVRRQPLAEPHRASPLIARLVGSELLDGFALNSAALTEEHKARLTILAQTLLSLLRERPGGLVTITGHTDATGGEGLNQGLGQQRADAVRDFLLEAGVPALAVVSVSAGESHLRVKRPGPEPRNRRAEVRFEPQPGGRSFPSTGLTLRSEPRPGIGGPPSLAPEQLCKANPKLSFCQPATEQEVPRGAIFPPPCRSRNCSAVGNRFDEQPPDLQRVLAASFNEPAVWLAQLDSGRRSALSAIFNRLCSYGVWCHVSTVLRIDRGEAPVGDLFAVPGATPSVHFTTLAGNGLYDALMASGRFCQATGAGASQHPGQSTLREISGSDSLHISIGPGDHFDAHIDRYSPAVEPTGTSFCSNAPTAAALGHIGREVVPEKVRKGFSFFGLFQVPGPPGFQLFPEDPAPSLTAVPQPETGAPRLTPGGSLVGITIGGPRSEPRKRAAAPAGARVLPVELGARIDRAIAEQVSPEALLPSHVRVRLAQARKAQEESGPDEEEAMRTRRHAAEQEATTYPDPYEVARELAERMERARRSHAGFVTIDLPQYDARDFGSRKAIAQQIQRMALIVRHYLPEGAANVYSVVISFGSDDAATREEVKLP